MKVHELSSRPKPLVAVMSGILGLGLANTLFAATIPVTSCADDGGFGTLRHAVLIASGNDTVDMSTLSCSTITLTSGAIHVDVDPLTILGPGEGKLTIDGANADRVFFHSGTQSLTLSDVTVAHGQTSGTKAYGGCIYSKGSVYLDHATVTACAAHGTAVGAAGGVLAFGTVHMYSGTVIANQATASDVTGAVAECGGVLGVQGAYIRNSLVSGNIAQAAHGKARGGGVGVDASLTVKYSTITGNQAIGAAPDYGAAGGIYGVTLNSVSIKNSTIDHNQADVAAGLSLAGSATASITQSTISSNTANIGAGGLDTSMNLTLDNSTIAFNQAGSAGAAGMFVSGGATIDLESSIIADNSPSGTSGGADLAGGGTITGAHNLIKISSTPVPADTITADPALGPLACNGGHTRTHALMPGSPAIDAGSASSALDFDQRGNGFPRDIGVAPDIGAYEWDPDRIFISGFDC